VSGRLAALALLAALGGCATARVYDGAVRPADELARIDGAPRFSAGLPIAAVIRKVDATVLSTGYSRASVAPGPHTVLIDCHVYAAHTTTRFELTIDAEAGSRYVLVPVSAAGNRACEAVHVEAR
jgi:hypothetical protein